MRHSVVKVTTDLPATTQAGSVFRRWGALFAVAWVAFLVQAVVQALELETIRGSVGALILMMFGVAYTLAGLRIRSIARSPDREDVRTSMTVTLAAMVVLAFASTALTGVIGLSTLPYIAVIGGVLLRRGGALWVLGWSAVALVSARGLGSSWNDAAGLATGTLSAGISVWAFIIYTSRQEARVRAAQAESALAVETERGRFARDLHDVVGHSLSVVALKAGLARRMLTVDPAAAAVELEEVERLARDALDDVRRAVAGYREMSLPGELATARAILEAAGIEADIPMTAEVVPSALRELFAWSIREGVTNVVRHSQAHRCRIELAERSVTVEDDGVGAFVGTPTIGGSGLAGLRERAAAAGAVVTTGPVGERGHRLTVAARMPLEAR